MAVTLELSATDILAERYAHVRARTESLAAPLSAGGPDRAVDAGRQPDEVAPGARDVVLRDVRARFAGSWVQPFHPSYAYLFNSYYEQIGTRHPRPDRGQVTRPGAAEVGAYRRAIDDRMLTFLGRPSDVVAQARRSSSWDAITRSSTRS